MIFHQGRTGSFIMLRGRAVSCVLKQNPPARIGTKIEAQFATQRNAEKLRITSRDAVSKKLSRSQSDQLSSYKTS